MYSRRFLSTLKSCLRCGNQLSISRVVCGECKAVAPIPETVSYFEIFGLQLPPQGDFDIDTRSLRKEFLKLQQLAHPDGFASSPDDEQRVAVSVSTHINRAYSTLSSPLSRAEYLLSLKGIKITEDEASSGQDLLMQVMEVRESIESSSCERELEPIKAENDKRIQTVIQELSQLFRTGNFEEAKRDVIRLRYWENVKQALDNWTPEGSIRLQH